MAVGKAGFHNHQDSPSGLKNGKLGCSTVSAQAAQSPKQPENSDKINSYVHTNTEAVSYGFLVRASGEWECPLCGSRGPAIAFDEHHIFYSPEITIFSCTNCHAQITRNKLSSEQQLQLKWSNEQLRLIILSYQKRIARLQAQIHELEKMKQRLLEPIKEYSVRQAISSDELLNLIEQGYEVVCDGVLRKRIIIPWRLNR